ncbi:MAG TPA: hypothetical protein ENN36_09405 [Candidatus Bathyarchaeota archaeon]|jgi:hypothetical protein|nr:hypothetical protein [Candidatus Bathyarchaeota archaeon]
MSKAPLRLRFLFHSLGLGCISSAIFLQMLVFWEISQTGIFKATEQNQTILSFEVFLAFFALIYFVYLYQKLVRSIR